VVLPCVDIAIFNSDYTELLLGRRMNETKWRFIGGHVERKHNNAEEAARTEVLEEAGLDPNAMEYIGSAKIPDWRYNTPDRGVMTTFFATTTMSMGAKAGDDIFEVRWFKVNQLALDTFVDTHHPLYILLRDWSVKKHLTPTIFSSTDRPHSAGNTLRQAINKEERETGTGALKLEEDSNAGTAKA
jgi:ADP-ribose pyrophosphatase YjhB (NUDIX family)